jgi:hypothetical protein
MDEPPEAPQPSAQPAADLDDDIKSKSPEDLLAEGDAIIREYQREVTGRLNERLDALLVNLAESIAITESYRRGLSHLNLAQKKKATALALQYHLIKHFGWRYYVTDGGHFMLRRLPSKLWFTGRYLLAQRTRRRTPRHHH